MIKFHDESVVLRNSSAIKGYTIAANDGHLGTVSDFLFDDMTWLVRWLVVDTGTWLFGRKVLLPASVLGHLDSKRSEFSVRLTKQEVKDGPDIDTKRPVSRQMEATVYDYYGWSPYWTSGFYLGGYEYGLGYKPGTAAPIPVRLFTLREENKAASRRSDDDTHLRSMEEVIGYHIHANDGEIGHVEDFLMEEADWSIHYLVVDTKNWWPGKKVLVSPRSVTAIDWTDDLVNINVGRQRVKDSPAYDGNTTVDRAYERKYHNYYGEVRPDSQQP
jgi:sporulation protein YlmC with PRC-barrel domain